MMIKKVFVIGGGASGMMAAIAAARNGHRVELYEKNEKLGKKLYITGKGRCNLTNACDRDTLFDNIVSNNKFFYHAYSELSNYDTIDFFERLGLPLKVERGDRVFPISDKSSDVIAALKKELERLGVAINLGCEVSDIIIKDGAFSAIRLKPGNRTVSGDAVIIATGGLSYPVTGSTGDGYEFARSIGHTVTKLTPSLVPLIVSEPFVKELEGLSLRNIRVNVMSGQNSIFSDFGELMFTRNGLSGPVILSASSYILPHLEKDKELIVSIDLKPALTEKQLDLRVLRDFEEFKNKQFKNSLERLLPNKLIDVIIRLCLINPDKRVNSITAGERAALVKLLKNFNFNITGLGGFNQAVITKGGVNVKEINPSTMESKLACGVYFAGEVLDLDALTGGFNLQIAWSSAYLAGSSIK